MTESNGKMQCPKCFGTGKVIDARATGLAFRQYRQSKGASLRDVAKLMNISVPYACDLELGRRGWRTELVTRYKKALEKL